MHCRPGERRSESSGRHSELTASLISVNIVGNKAGPEIALVAHRPPPCCRSGCQGQRNLQGTAAADVIHIGHLCRTIFFWRNVPSAFYMSGARSMTFLPGA